MVIPKKKRGRPVLAKATRRTEVIRVLLTKEDRHRLEQAAEKDLRSLSDWMRAVALRSLE